MSFVFGNAEIAVEIACHRVCAFGFVAVVPAAGADIQMHCLVLCTDIGNAAEAQILCLAAHRLCGNNTAGIVVAHYVCRCPFCVLPCSVAADCLVVCRAAVAAVDDDLAAVQRRIQLLQLVHQLCSDLAAVVSAAFAAELSGVEMFGDLRGIAVGIGFQCHEIISFFLCTRCTNPMPVFCRIF